ncbi:YkgJ family cysteine cluster protein [Helicobacter sp. NHP21005]|uniref:YkgJ family cysteine cluster protein n=1 Tax=Helicobacter felistomachi TaxID=3040201 RepID=UPI0025734D7C|nr:YkgJ family cysteine cluster protein [Helicobacter sp. NHP21005]BEG56953.1 YkgJ family cysteine cluster protein [Helicobacter sp. NHP21005]
MDFSFDQRACVSCGARCCLGKEGYIFLKPTEMEAISVFLKLPFEVFTRKYIKKVGYRYSLLEKPAKDPKEGYACVFLDEESKRCQIYPVRPKQCQTFPFWECFKSEKGIEELCALCPGVKPLN